MMLLNGRQSTPLIGSIDYENLWFSNLHIANVAWEGFKIRVRERQVVNYCLPILGSWLGSSTAKSSQFANHVSEWLEFSSLPSRIIRKDTTQDIPTTWCSGCPIESTTKIIWGLPPGNKRYQQNPNGSEEVGSLTILSKDHTCPREFPDSTVPHKSRLVFSFEILLPGSQNRERCQRSVSTSPSQRLAVKNDYDRGESMHPTPSHGESHHVSSTQRGEHLRPILTYSEPAFFQPAMFDCHRLTMTRQRCKSLMTHVYQYVYAKSAENLF